MEEYIKKLLEQVRFEKAHKAIGDEIRSHIEEQMEENISEGMDKETAEKAAVEDMGDPVDAGISLDKVHRPQVAWGVIVTAIVLGVIGIVINILLEKEILGSYVQYSSTQLYKVHEYASYIINFLLGIAVMLLFYFIDFTTLAKYSDILAGILLITRFATYYVFILSSDLFFANSFEYIPAWYSTIAMFFVHPVLVCSMIPLFAGILYKYKGQKYSALVKALIWIIVSYMLGAYGYLESTTIIITICMLIELSIAIQKEWIKVPKIASIISVWTLLVVIPAGVTIFMYKNGLFDQTKMAILKWTFSRNFEYKKYEDTINAMKLFGSGKINYFDGTVPISTKLYISEMGDITFDIAAVWGLAAAFAVIAAVAGLIVLGFVVVSKTKNQLGLVMGSGCLMWLAMNAIGSICGDFMTLPIIVSGFIPFISSYSVMIVVMPYAFLGIILSIYKYKNAYPAHVDVSIRRKAKDYVI